MYFKMVAYHIGKVKDCVDDCLFTKCLSWYKGKQFCGKYQCCYCQKLLKRGDAVVRIIYHMDKGYYGKRDGKDYEKRASLMFHRNCYLEHTKLWIDNQLSLHPVRFKSKVGRPKKHDSPEEVNKLKSLLTYHKKAGNISRVGEIEGKIKELEE